MTKHTPGPWLYRPQNYDDWGFVRVGEPDAEGYRPLVAMARSGKLTDERELDEHRSNGTDPYEANARLIAAAPELLEACKQTLMGLDLEYGPSRTDVNFPLLRPAIAKAEAEGR